MSEKSDFIIESLGTAKDNKTCARMARELAIHLIENPGAATDPVELVGAYEDSLENRPSMKRAFEDFPSQSYRDVIDAIGNLLVDQKSACVLLTKKSTLVIAPTTDKRYIVLDVNSKKVSYTKAPEYLPVKDVVDVSVISSAIDPIPLEPEPVVVEVKKEPEPVAKKAKKNVTIAQPPPEKKKRARKLVAPIIESNTPTDDAVEPVAKVVKSEPQEVSAEETIKTATL